MDIHLKLISDWCHVRAKRIGQGQNRHEHGQGKEPAEAFPHIKPFLFHSQHKTLTPPFPLPVYPTTTISPTLSSFCPNRTTAQRLSISQHTNSSIIIHHPHHRAKRQRGSRGTEPQQAGGSAGQDRVEPGPGRHVDGGGDARERGPEGGSSVHMNTNSTNQ